MDKKKSVINIIVSLTFKLVLLVLTILSKRFLINYVGNEANGIFSLYTSLIGFLAIADLGIGSAITFAMYDPIVKGDDAKVAAFYKLFIKVYRIIGLIILVGGLCILPALPYIAKNHSTSFNLYYTFLLMLASIVLTYLFSAKISVINAYKNEYITTTFNSISLVVVYILQIVSVIIFKSFELYLGIRIIGVIIQWIAVNIYFNKHHKSLINYNNKLDEESKKIILKTTKAMFMHKIGGLLVNTCDSIIISAFIGVVLLGKYSNYVTIVTSMTSVIVLFFTPLTAIIGHLCVMKDLDREQRYFNFFFTLNFIIGMVFFLGYYAVIDDAIYICFGDNLELTKDISFVITLNYFIQFMRQACLLFRDATGTFYNDRYKPILEGIVNVILSLIFVNIIGIVGVIVATIITNLLICHIVEPYVLYKHVFEKKPTNYYILNYSFIGMFTLCLIAMHFSMINIENQYLSLLVNGVIAVAISIIPVTIAFIVVKDFRKYILKFSRQLKEKILG